jgi:hypothetical protein
MSCKGETNTNGAYLVAMIGRGGSTTTCVTGEEMPEDIEDEGLGGME